ncbi:MAG TPA: CDP-alcohol phosphatidyltransferase family protein [Novosphingobium sp.]|nr:CDP-alcohol phosphatidyltransferase family protein [Novosphingobium sp.]
MTAPDKSGFKLDKRVNESWLANYEFVALNTIARRLPDWVTPNQLTGLGMAGAAMVTLGGLLSRYEMAWLWLSNAGLVVHWLGDSLDGTVARLRRVERPRYGFYLDQVIDTFGNLLISVGVGLCPLVRMDLSLVILAVYQMLSVQVLVRAIVDREFHLAVGRMGPTELRIGIVCLNLLLMAFGSWHAPGTPAWLSWENVLMGATIVGLLGLFFWQMDGHLARLAAEDRPAPPQRHP